MTQKCAKSIFGLEHVALPVHQIWCVQWLLSIHGLVYVCFGDLTSRFQSLKQPAVLVLLADNIRRVFTRYTSTGWHFGLWPMTILKKVCQKLDEIFTWLLHVMGHLGEVSDRQTVRQTDMLSVCSITLSTVWYRWSRLTCVKRSNRCVRDGAICWTDVIWQLSAAFITECCIIIHFIMFFTNLTYFYPIIRQFFASL